MRERVVPHVVADERDPPLLQEVRHVGVVAGDALLGRVPGAERRPPLPAAGVQQDDVARLDPHALDALQLLEIRGADRRAGLHPAPPGVVLARQQRGVEQDAAREDALPELVDASLGATFRRRHLLDRHPVVALAVEHHVAGDRVEVAVDDAVVGAGVLVAVRGAGLADVDHLPVQIPLALERRRLDDVVGQRHAAALGHQRGGGLPLGRRDEVGGAQPVVRTPAAPVRQFLQRVEELRLGGHRGTGLGVHGDGGRADQKRRKDGDAAASQSVSQHGASFGEPGRMYGPAPGPWSGRPRLRGSLLRLADVAHRRARSHVVTCPLDDSNSDSFTSSAGRASGRRRRRSRRRWSRPACWRSTTWSRSPSVSTLLWTCRARWAGRTWRGSRT